MSDEPSCRSRRVRRAPAVLTLAVVGICGAFCSHLPAEAHAEQVAAITIVVAASATAGRVATRPARRDRQDLRESIGSRRPARTSAPTVPLLRLAPRRGPPLLLH